MHPGAILCLEVAWGCLLRDIFPNVTGSLHTWTGYLLFFFLKIRWGEGLFHEGQPSTRGSSRSPKAKPSPQKFQHSPCGVRDRQIRHAESYGRKRGEKGKGRRERGIEETGREIEERGRGSSYLFRRRMERESASWKRQAIAEGTVGSGWGFSLKGSRYPDHRPGQQIIAVLASTIY